MMRRLLLAAALLLLPTLQQPEPTVRIGLGQNAATVTVRSSGDFRIQGQTTKTAKFSPILSLADVPNGTVIAKDQLQYRMAIELDGARYLVVPMTTHVRIQPPAGTARLQINDRSYRGIVEVFGNTRNTLTIVNELPLEDYLLGVVPNELSPNTFGQIEALKAQAVAARTYIVRNMGQSRTEGYDICDTDSCQVYMGAGTEDPLATRAVTETRGIVATYDGQPINALYSSTCGGRTESSENIFSEKLPYLVSVMCVYKHPEPKPFATQRVITDFKDAVLTVAGVSNYSQLRRFLGISGTGEPPSNSNLTQLAKYLRENFYPSVKTLSDLDFLVEQGILPMSGDAKREDVLFRMIERKGAFEWQQGVLLSWDGQTMKINVGGQPTDFQLSRDAPIFFRSGEERSAMKQGTWIGGELFDFRAVKGVIQMAVYRRNFVNATADRFSRLALWQVHKTKQEVDTAFRPLNLGEILGLQVLERGPSERPLNTEVRGALGKTSIRALRLRQLLGLRDSLFYFDEERNAQGDLLGITFYGTGWGHGVGMCQVGAFGMAMDGAQYDEILKTYYTGIDLKKMY